MIFTIAIPGESEHFCPHPSKSRACIPGQAQNHASVFHIGQGVPVIFILNNTAAFPSINNPPASSHIRSQRGELLRVLCMFKIAEVSESNEI